MTVWSPGMRDTGVAGVAALLRRPAWRTSSAAPTLVATVTAGLHDDNPLVRMHAARAVRALDLNATADEQASTIGELALAEQHPTVRSNLLDQLGHVINAAAPTVDAILELLIDSDDTLLATPNRDPGSVVLSHLTHLALVNRTPFATRTIRRWCQDAPIFAPLAEAFTRHARNYLAATGEPAQRTAFELLDVAARAALARWTQNPAEHQAGKELPPEALADLRGAIAVTHEIAEQIYFASGAFEAKQNSDQAQPPSNLAGFADLALPILSTCVELGDPQTIHQAVETLHFLAPLDEARSLHAIASAVPLGSLYTSDALAGGLIMPYLERLLAEHRRLVLVNPRGVASFRHLLEAFAGAGDDKALALAYTFAEVFR